MSELAPGVVMVDWGTHRQRFARTLAYRAGRTIAALASEGGRRLRVDWVEAAFHSGLIDGLAEAGVSRKGMADMMGVSLRTLQRVVAKETERAPQRSWWVRVHNTLRDNPMTEKAFLAGSPVGRRSFLRSVLHDLVDHGWLKHHGDVLQAIGDRAPWTEAELLEALAFETLVFPNNAAGLARIFDVEVERVEALLDQIPEGRRIDTVDSDESAFVGLLGMALHTHGLFERRPGNRAQLYQIQVEHLPSEALEALERGLQALLEQSEELYMSIPPRGKGRGGDVVRWSIVVSRDIPMQLEV